VWEFDAVYFKKRSLLLEQKDGARYVARPPASTSTLFRRSLPSLIESAEKPEIFSEREAASFEDLLVTIHRVRESRPWLANTRFWNWVRRLGSRVLRGVRRDGAIMYQDYPSG